jgi:hypothetical protein
MILKLLLVVVSANVVKSHRNKSCLIIYFVEEWIHLNKHHLYQREKRFVSSTSLLFLNDSRLDILLGFCWSLVCFICHPVGNKKLQKNFEINMYVESNVKDCIIIRVKLCLEKEIFVLQKWWRFREILKEMCLVLLHDRQECEIIQNVYKRM